ncbi:hypothetical protein NE237_021846 [Protea cynaroides]|uniref:Uncharacterized protein n=1 Tax=Protea cynaroides TaxID=273540 RepID=A0A9Q0K3N3_9MAGN|nr:hypothetical protein NE237_021846 [Protea cynaroides]
MASGLPSPPRAYGLIMPSPNINTKTLGHNLQENVVAHGSSNTEIQGQRQEKCFGRGSPGGDEDEMKSLIEEMKKKQRGDTWLQRRGSQGQPTFLFHFVFSTLFWCHIAFKMGR